MLKVCPVCRSKEIDEIVYISAVPALANVLWSDQERAVSAKKGDICLVICRNCSFIFNSAYDPDLVDYDCCYENSLHCSNTFNGYCERLASDLSQRLHLKDKTIIEIGCGQGQFLSMLQHAGDNLAIGFDPSYRGAEPEEHDKTKIYTCIFPPKHPLEQEPDFLCCRHVLEHIFEPEAFVEEVTAAAKPRCKLYFEVPNANYMLRLPGIWDLLYEHFAYYTTTALKYLFLSAGCENIQVTERFYDQYLGLEAYTGKKRLSTNCQPQTHQIVTSAQKFGKAYKEKVQEWAKYLDSLVSKGEKVIIWGAGAKGIMFLNFLGMDYRTVPFITDINPAKHGCFLTGSGQMVIPPEELTSYRPDKVIIMNPAYKNEIEADLQRMDLHKAQILIA
ncbi:hypothetical protein STSP2_02633 [Anaerohalosphaera lusitana]|uniref:C-methyltransferase domain-containing protein n=1 Tax=Anaerohalosphaera lusitana TaxID=1936003 RepID=A0A1U9NNG3_9BACT|nr:class I SAM-dependent methyltransferase [Anaerohalosphaera lusitana]AQT69443.1 hypothetical protein STSP2_02633 [Anaerohalosphaera lusitana]